MGEPRHGRGDVPLRGREARQAALSLEVVELLASQLATLDRERADELVVALRHVPGARRLGDLGVVQLGRIAVDVEDPPTEAPEWLDDEILEDCLLGGSRANAVAADRVEADGGGAVPGRADEGGEPGE